jgi:hypothetical protein
MENRTARVLAFALLFAVHSGAQVMAGADGVLTLGQALWTAGTVAAAGAIGWLTDAPGNRKNGPSKYLLRRALKKIRQTGVSSRSAV